MLRIGGIAAVIVPQGVLFGTGKAFVEIRKMLLDKCEVKAVISMPSGVFKPYAGVATAILVFVKGGETKYVWFYEMLSDGRTLDDKRSELKLPNGNRNFGDLHLIYKEYFKTRKNKDRSKQNFVVPKSELEEKNYDLSFNKYKIAPNDLITFDPPNKIIKKISQLEDEIQKGIKEIAAFFK